MRFPPLNRWFTCIGVGIATIPAVAGAMPQNSPSSRAPGSHSQAFPPLGTPIAQLKPMPSGPGLVVCEPVPIRTTPDVADFGAGCSRWLQFVVGGQGELGTTPLWSDLTRAQQELGRNDLRLGLEASRLKNILGVTYVAIGTIQGNPNHCNLTYQLYSLSPRVRMKASLVAEGTQAQVLARLPDLAKRLARNLGVKTPHVPSRVEGNAAEIATLGHLASLDGNAYTQAQTQQLMQLAGRIPLAGMITLSGDSMRYTHDGFLGDYYAYTPDMITKAARTLTRLAPDNPLVYGVIGWRSSRLALSFEAPLAKLNRRFPNNYNLACVHTWRQYIKSDTGGTIQAAERAARIGAANPDAWILLCEAIEEAANVVRKDVYWEAMNSRQQTYVSAVYARQLQTAQRAVALDPLEGKGWFAVSVAAASAGQGKLADTAFWKAMSLDADDPQVYWWGLQMYQPKWFEDKTKLNRVAYRATAVTFTTPDKTFYLANNLKGQGMRDKAMPLFSRAANEFRGWVQRAPKDYFARTRLYTSLINANRIREAIPECEALIQLYPDDSTAHFTLGTLSMATGNFNRAIQELKQVLRIAPHNSMTWNQLGLALRTTGALKESVEAYRQAVRYAPNDATQHRELANVLYMTKQFVPAMQEYRTATKLAPSDAFNHEGLSEALYQNKQYNSSLREARIALTLNPNFEMAHDSEGLAYEGLHSTEDAIAEYRTALRMSPNDAVAHYELGDCLNQTGHRAEARAEWNQVLRLDQGEVAKHAQQQLQKYP